MDCKGLILYPEQLMQDHSLPLQISAVDLRVSGHLLQKQTKRPP